MKLNLLSRQQVKHWSLKVENNELQEQVRNLLLQGKKIEAIKIYREASGLGLKESKDAVEIIESNLRGSGLLPQKAKSGCFGMLGLLLILIYGVLRQF
jgi:hypothetical protein